MKDQMPLSAKLSCLPIALVAFSMAFGAPAVRAQSDGSATSWRELADPIMNAIHAVEARLASIEASVALFAGSFTTRELNTRELCISDETGARTCITKAQLDTLLARMAQSAAAEPTTSTAEAPAAVVEAPAAVTESHVAADPEPETLDRDAKDSAAVEAAVEETPAAAQVTELAESGSKEDSPAAIDPAAGETIIMVAPEPAAIPAEAIQQDAAPRDQEPATTGSVTSEPSRDGLVTSQDAAPLNE
jgi:hypothetical protein